MEPFTNANWIALASVIISLVALLKSFLTDRKAKRLDLQLKQQLLKKHEQETLENKKAEVEVNVVEIPKGACNRLCFYNKGKSIAYNVNFKILSDSDNSIQLRISDNYLPFPKLLPQQGFDIYYIDFGNVPHHTILITWDDEFEKERSKEIVVDM